MDELSDVIIISGNNTCAYNIENGAAVATYKESSIAPKTLSLIGEDYMIGAVANQPKLRVWTLSQARILEQGTFTCRGIVTALTVSSCGTYCIGAIEKELHIWQVHSGELLNIISRHYGDISCLKMSSDDSHVLSGGKDGHVLVWILSQMIDVQLERNQTKPRFVWPDHAAEVTDICTGPLGPLSRVATTSLDMTCRIYELDTGLLLTTIFMDTSLTSVVLDALEYYVILGDIKGTIYKINTYEQLPKEIFLDEKVETHYKSHEERVFSLSISLDGNRLLSASADRICRLWELESMSCILEFPHEGEISNAFLVPKPKSLAMEAILPQFIVNTFKKEFDDPIRNGSLKYETSMCTPKILTLLDYGSTDLHYSTNILSCYGNAAAKEVDDPQRNKFEELCQESLHGGMVHELKTINNQLYAYLINHGMENAPHTSSE